MESILFWSVWCPHCKKQTFVEAVDLDEKQHMICPECGEADVVAKAVVSNDFNKLDQSTLLLLRDTLVGIIERQP